VRSTVTQPIVSLPGSCLGSEESLFHTLPVNAAIPTSQESLTAAARQRVLH